MKKYKLKTLVATFFVALTASLVVIPASSVYACLNPDNNFSNDCSELGYYTNEQASALFVRGETSGGTRYLFTRSDEVVPEQTSSGASDTIRQLQYFGYYNYRFYYDSSGGGQNGTLLLVDEDNPASGVLIYLVGGYPANSDGEPAAYQEPIVRSTVSVVNDPEDPPLVDASGNPVDDPTGGGEEETLPSCNTEGGEFSWLACPIIRGMLGATEFITNIMDSLLQIQPLSSDDAENNALYDVWNGMRNVALAFLVIAVLIAIFGQALSLNIDAYTMKKMVPRIAIVAIGIMLSYYFVAFLIDIFNVLGNGIQSLMFQAIGDNEISVTSGGKWAGGILAALGTGGAIALVLNPATLATIGLILLPVVIAFMSALLIIILRQVIIVALVAISPLALVAWLLPNTEQYFKRWYSLLFTMLMMYPLIMVLLGAGSLFAVIVTNGGSVSDPNIVNNNFVNYLLALAGIAASMAAVPFTLRAAGGLLGRIAGVINDPNRGLIDRARRGMQTSRDEAKEERKQDRLAALRRGTTDKGKEIKGLRKGIYRATTGTLYGGKYGDIMRAKAEEQALPSDQRKELARLEGRDRRDKIADFQLKEQVAQWTAQGRNQNAILRDLNVMANDKELQREDRNAAFKQLITMRAVPQLEDVVQTAAASGRPGEVESVKRLINDNFGDLDSFAAHISRSDIRPGSAPGEAGSVKFGYGAIATLPSSAQVKQKETAIAGAIEEANTDYKTASSHPLFAIKDKNSEAYKALSAEDKQTHERIHKTANGATRTIQGLMRAQVDARPEDRNYKIIDQLNQVLEGGQIKIDRVNPAYPSDPSGADVTIEKTVDIDSGIGSAVNETVAQNFRTVVQSSGGNGTSGNPPPSTPPSPGSSGPGGGSTPPPSGGSTPPSSPSGGTGGRPTPPPPGSAFSPSSGESPPSTDQSSKDVADLKYDPILNEYYDPASQPYRDTGISPPALPKDTDSPPEDNSPNQESS